LNVNTSQEALAAVEGQTHVGLTRVVREHIFVGHVDEASILLQQGTKLYLADLGNISRDVMYQLALRGFRQFEPIALEDKPPLRDLLTIGLEAQQLAGLLDADEDKPVSARIVSREPCVFEACQIVSR
jgi:DNA mismatch repair protein MLH1